MSNRKRARRAELDVKSATPKSSTKRAKTSDTNTSDKNFYRVERACTYNHVLVVWSQPMTPRQQDFLVRQMTEMRRLMSSNGLLTAEAAIRHLPSIENPLDLTTMRTYLEADRYSSVTDFCADFKRMITDVHLQYGQDDNRSIVARKLLRSFCERIRHCPTGPNGESARDYGEKAIKCLESRIVNATTKVTTPSSEEIEVINIASDTDELAETTIQVDTASFINTFNDRHSDTSDYEPEDDVSDAEVDSSSLTQDEPASVTRAAKTPEPDDLDDETRQLQKEIEERQQKLANMAEKKKLLAGIKDLDTEKAELDDKIPELEKQLWQVRSKVQDCRNMIGANHNDEKKIFDAIDWHDGERVRLHQESERLEQESERLRQESQKCRQRIEVHKHEVEELGLVESGYRQRHNALLAEKQQAKEQGRQILQNEGQLKERRDQLENQRAIAKKKLDALSNGNT
ncbi:hypothetical protein KCU91_g8801, partial [Aureobasidium melanogenum]